MLRRGVSSLAGIACRNGQWRGLAKAAGPEIKPPIQLHGIPGRYASALWCAAAKANMLPQVEDELQKVFEAAKKNADFNAFLVEPVTSRQKKKEGVESLLKDMGVCDITKNFFLVLAENGRMSHAEKVWSTFGTLMQAHRKEVMAKVTSAEPLESGEVREVRECLQKLLREGETLKLQQQVDPTIIGGLVVELGDKYIDLSVEKRIREMEKLLMEAI